MNLAEIRKKAGAVKREEAAVLLADEPAAPEISEESGRLDNSVPFESFSEPPAVAAPFFEDMVSDEEYTEVPAEVDLAVADDLPVEPEAALPAVPVIAAGPDFQPVRIDTRPVTVAPVKSSKPAVIDVIVAGREASSDAEDMVTVTVNDSSTEIEEYLCFRVADEEYAISIMSIKEIIKPREVTEVPRVPLYIQGVISLRGLIIPVMDMRCRLSLPVGSGTGRERIVVVRKDAGFCGILVDEVVQVARVAKRDIEEPPAILDGIDKAFVKGLGHHDGRMIILLDLEAILDAGMH